jgi:hypothetical protein
MAKKPGRTERSARAEIGSKQRAYLRDTFRELGITASGAAKALELAPSTFTRFMKLPDSSEKTLSARTMDQVEQLRQINSESPVPTTAQAAWGNLREEAVRILISDGNADAPLARVLAALIGDRDGIEPWQLHTRALELEGFLPGDIVLVDQNASPRPGDAVYATIEERRGKPEPIMRQFQHAGPVNVLVPRTMDPKAPPALVVDRDKIVIRGVLLPHRLSGTLAA